MTQKPTLPLLLVEEIVQVLCSLPLPVQHQHCGPFCRVNGQLQGKACVGHDLEVITQGRMRSFFSYQQAPIVLLN
jgi:hypothetical protein